MPNNQWSKPDLSKDEKYCRRCGYIGMKKSFELSFGERGAGSGGACPSCSVLQIFAGDNPPPRDKRYRWNLHAYKRTTCGRCGLVLEPIMAMSEHVKHQHTLSECDEILQQTGGDS